MGAVHGRFVVPVDDSVEDVEWQPADSEGHNDAEQHDADALCLMAAVLVLTHSLHHTLPLPQTDVDLKGKATGKRQGESDTMRGKRKGEDIQYSFNHGPNCSFELLLKYL